MLGFTAIVLIVVAVIAILIALAIVNARRSAREQGMRVTRRTSGIAWIYWGVGLSLPVLLAMAIWNFVITRAVADMPSPAALAIEVTGHRWWWEIRYRNAEPAKIITTANEIVIPTGVPIRFYVTSADVIHDFWVPKLGPKMDMVPGIWNQTWFQADVAGTYLGQCAEFCGLEHAKMGLRVRAVTPEQFAAWQTAAQAPATIALSEGHAVFARSCAACHTVRGTEAGGIVGPDLTHFADRTTLAAGILANTLDNRRRWLSETQRLKPGALMPQVPLSEQDLTAVVNYLGSLH
jgi:cytochrome c oxidase subunit 2